jgi:AcrR family transcriptional regulator
MANTAAAESAGREVRAVVKHPGHQQDPLFSQSDAAVKGAETREGRRERHRRETFERLVEAAREILFSRELDQVTVHDITEAADVGKGTFFNYFRSKEHMVSRLLVSRQKTWEAAIERVRCGQQTALEALVALARSYLLPERGGWLTYENNLMAALASVEVRAVLSDQVQLQIELRTTLMALGQEQGTIRRDLTARQLATFAHTFFAGFTVMLWIDRTPPTPELVDETMSWLVKVLQPGASAPRVKARRRRGFDSRHPRSRRP